MWNNLKVVVPGLMIVLAPVGLRVLTWDSAPKHDSSQADVQAGHELFVHQWTPSDPLCPEGDGLGPVFNADSCVDCHHQGGVGGSGGLPQNVTTFVRRPDGRTNGPLQGVVHAFATHRRYLETLSLLSDDLPATSRPSLEDIRDGGGSMIQCRLPGQGQVQLSQRNTPALFGSRLIDEISDRVIIAEERKQRLRWGMVGPESEETPVGRAFRLADGRVGKFGWKAQSASLADFVQSACANELGLGNPGQAQPAPLMFASYAPKGLDLTERQCDQITAFCASLDRPVEQMPTDPLHAQAVEEGRELFATVGCAQCHVPDLGPVEGIYSDLLLHRMGVELVGAGDYNQPAPIPSSPSPGDSELASPLGDEWRTPPLWGVADSAPYLHDGRAETLEEAILEHAGQADLSRQRFQSLAPHQQEQLLAFLQTLRAPREQP